MFSDTCLNSVRARFYTTLWYFSSLVSSAAVSRMASLQLLTLLCFVFYVSGSIASKPHTAESFNASFIQVLFSYPSLVFLPKMQNFGRCSYTVIISTSCSSPRYTRDQISLYFGDGYGNQVKSSAVSDFLCIYWDFLRWKCVTLWMHLGFVLLNQVYAPRLDDPGRRAFEQCSSDTYEINGPCAHQICYVYLYRSGPDGWVPGSIKIFSYGSKAVTFSYNTFIPQSIWYGFNYCNNNSHSNSLAFGVGKLILVWLATLLL